MRCLLLIAGLMMLTGCASISEGNRKMLCSLDGGCVQTPLCDNLEDLTLKQVEERFETAGSEKQVQNVSAKNPGQFRIYQFYKDYPDRQITLYADLFFHKEKNGEYLVSKVQRCELRRPTADGRAYVNGIRYNIINKMKNERGE